MTNEFGQLSAELKSYFAKAKKIDKNFSLYIYNKLIQYYKEKGSLDPLFIAEFSFMVMDVILNLKIQLRTAVKYFIISLIMVSIKCKLDTKILLKSAVLELVNRLTKDECEPHELRELGFALKKAKGQAARYCLRNGMTWNSINEAMSGLWTGLIDGINNLLLPTDKKLEILKEVESEKHWDMGYYMDYFLDGFWP